MGTRFRCWQLAREQQLVAPACLSAILFLAAAMIADVRHQPGSGSLATYAVAGAAYLSLAVFYRRPAVTVPVTAAASIALIVMGMPYPVTMPALFGALFSFAVRNDRRRTLALGIPVKAAIFTADILAHPGIAALVVTLWAALATSLGNGVRSHRAYIAEVEGRAQRAERDAEEQARRRVAQERLRIARDLHDAVGHHVALVAIQAGALSCLLDGRQQQARQSVANIQRASANALEDLRLTVGLLRQPSDDPGGSGDGEAAPVDPLPGLNRIDELIGSFTSAGLAVSHEVAGQARPLPEAADLTAYRVIQESLTNTSKHASSPVVRIRVEYEPDALHLAIEDEGSAYGAAGLAPAWDGQGDGHGITGMRERVAALGGWLSAGACPGGGFRVLARLPTPAGDPGPACVPPPARPLQADAS
jgi:signal transduction histidine kinase